MNIAKVKKILTAHTALVWQLSTNIHSNGPLQLKVMSQPIGLMMPAEAAAKNLSLVTFPGVAVVVNMPEAKRYGGVITRILDLPRQPYQREMSAWQSLNMLDHREFDIGWKIRLVAFGHLVSGWKLHPSRKEMLWHMELAGQRERSQAAAILKIFDKA